MFKPFARTSLTLLLLCTLPLGSQAAVKEAPLDLSIITQSEALRPYMTAQQRLAFVKASQLVKQGESDIRSGNSLLQQKASALNPNKDIKSAHDRGKRLIKEGEVTIIVAQKQLIELLTGVEAQRNSDQTLAAKKYNFSLVEKEYAAALKTAAQETLRTCRANGYKHILFDGLHIVTAAQTSKAAPAVHNAAYDTWIKADGTQFSVSVPLDLKLVKSETTDEYAFQYSNASAFEGEKTALLAIEVIAPDNGPDALLSVRALDIDTQQLVSSTLFYIADASQALGLTSPATDTAIAPTTAPALEVARTIPQYITINDTERWIEKLAGLASPYLFDTTSSTENPAQAPLLSALLKDTLLKNSKLQLIESGYVYNTYATEALSRGATATLTVTQDAEVYTISAEAHASGRILEIGTMELTLPESQ